SRSSAPGTARKPSPSPCSAGSSTSTSRGRRGCEPFGPPSCFRPQRCTSLRTARLAERTRLVAGVDSRVPVEPADTDHRGWQGEDLRIAGNDRCLLRPAGGDGKGISIGERVPRFDSRGFKDQGLASRYDLDRKRLHQTEAFL